MIAAAKQDDAVLRFSEIRKAYNDRNGYRAVERSKYSRPLMSPYQSGTRADNHFRAEHQYHLMAELAEDLDRNNMLAGQAIDRLICNVLQEGFTLDPMTGDKEVDKILKEEWQNYTQDESRCDHLGDFDFHTLGAISLKSALTRGDLVSLPLQDESIQLVENYRLRSPDTKNNRIRFGVELGKTAKPRALWLTDDDLTDFSAVPLKKSRRYDLYDDQGNKRLFLHKLPGRITSARGISMYSPIMHAFGMHDDIQFAKMVQQQMVSCVTLVRKRGSAFEQDDEAYWDHRQEPDPCRPGHTRPVKEMSPGMWYTTLPDEDLNVLNSNVPNPTFFDHAKSMQQLIGLNFGLPLIMFLMDASETNFSGWRGALDQAKMGFKKIQGIWRRSWYRQHYTTKLRMWADSPMQNRTIARQFRRLGPNLFKHGWILPVWPYVEPLKDIQADALELRTAMNSPRRIQERRSRDWDVVHTEIVDDMAKLVRRAKTVAQEINTEFPDDGQPVTWRDLSNMSSPEGVAATINTEDKEDASDTDENRS